nr:cytosine deaminase [Pseudaminobacter sp.]
MPSLTIPQTGSFTLANANLHSSVTPKLSATFDADGFTLADLSVVDGRIASIAARGGEATPAGATDLAGRIVLPCFVDCHTHID